MTKVLFIKSGDKTWDQQIARQIRGICPLFRRSQIHPTDTHKLKDICRVLGQFDLMVIALDYRQCIPETTRALCNRAFLDAIPQGMPAVAVCNDQQDIVHAVRLFSRLRKLRIIFPKEMNNPRLASKVQKAVRGYSTNRHPLPQMPAAALVRHSGLSPEVINFPKPRL